MKENDVVEENEPLEKFREALNKLMLEHKIHSYFVVAGNLEGIFNVAGSFLPSHLEKEAQHHLFSHTLKGWAEILNKDDDVSESSSSVTH